MLSPHRMPDIQLSDSLGIDRIQEVNSWKEYKEKSYCITSCLKMNDCTQLRPITGFSAWLDPIGLAENVACYSFIDRASPK